MPHRPDTRPGMGGILYPPESPLFPSGGVIGSSFTSMKTCGSCLSVLTVTSPSLFVSRRLVRPVRGTSLGLSWKTVTERSRLQHATGRGGPSRLPDRWRRHEPKPPNRESALAPARATLRGRDESDQILGAGRSRWDMNSSRVSLVVLNVPSTLLVTIVAPPFWTPRIARQRCSASITTPTPYGFSRD